MATLLTGSNLEKLLKEDGMLVQYFNNYLNLEVSSILIKFFVSDKTKLELLGFRKMFLNVNRNPSHNKNIAFC